MTFSNNKLGSLTKRAEFLFVRDGHYKAVGGIVIQMRENPAHSTIRVGFTATKKIGNAVTRNLAKRRLRQIARSLLPRLGQAGYDYVFIARDTTTQRNFERLQQDAEKALTALTKPVTKTVTK